MTSFAREGIELDTSTLADWVGTCTANLSPLVALIRAHVMAAERLHGDDTTVPVLAKNKTSTGRLWAYVRDDRPFAGPAPPAALFYYSSDRRGGVGKGSACAARGMPTEGNIRSATSLSMPAFYRPTPMPGLPSFTIPDANRVW